MNQRIIGGREITFNVNNQHIYRTLENNIPALKSAPLNRSIDKSTGGFRVSLDEEVMMRKFVYIRNESIPQDRSRMMKEVISRQ